MTAIDIVVPCYNYAHYLETCVASILSQDDVAVRVLIIDDCSTDDTPAVAARLAAEDSRVTAVRNEVNLGLIGTANRGMIDWAEAPYSLLISADDALTPGALSRATAVLESHPEAGFVFGAVVVLGADPTPPESAEADSFEYRIIDGPALMEHICHHANDIPTPTAVVRTALQKQVGGYNPATPHTSDMEMWLRLAAHAKIGVIQAAQGYYRVHGSNMSGAFFAQPTRDAEQRLMAAEQALWAVGPRVASFPDIVHTMKRIEADRACWRASLAFEAGDRPLGETFLRFAAATSPSPYATPAFWRASAKRRLGPRTLHGLRRLAGRPTRPRALADEVRELAPGQTWGWGADEVSTAFRMKPAAGPRAASAGREAKPATDRQDRRSRRPAPVDPLVTVIIPAYNAAWCIERTLRSVQAQTVRDFEVIIVDDGSKDETASVVSAAIADDVRFRLIRQVNGGVSAARNRALMEARGRYVANIDADDLWRPDFLAKTIEALEAAGEEAPFAFARSIWIDASDTLLPMPERRLPHRVDYRELLLRNPLGNGSCALMRTEAARAVGGWDVDLVRSFGLAEDWLLQLQLAGRGPIAAVDEPLVLYRISPQSSSNLIESSTGAGGVLEVIRRCQRDGPRLRRSDYWNARSLALLWLVRRARDRRQDRLAILLAAQAYLRNPLWFRLKELREPIVSLLRRPLAPRSGGAKPPPKGRAKPRPAADEAVLKASQPRSRHTALRLQDEIPQP